MNLDNQGIVKILVEELGEVILAPSHGFWARKDLAECFVQMRNKTEHDKRKEDRDTCGKRREERMSDITVNLNDLWFYRRRRASGERFAVVVREYRYTGAGCG